MQQPPRKPSSITLSSSIASLSPTSSIPAAPSLPAPIESMLPTTVIAILPINNCSKFKLQELLKIERGIAITEKLVFDGLSLPVGIPKCFAEKIADFLPHNKKDKAIAFAFAFLRILFLSTICKDCSPGQEMFFLVVKNNDLISQLYYSYAEDKIKEAIDKDNGKVLCFTGGSVELFFTIIPRALMQQMNSDVVYENLMNMTAEAVQNCHNLKEQLEAYLILQDNLRIKFYAKVQGDISKTAEVIRGELKVRIEEIYKERFGGRLKISKKGIGRLVENFMQEGEQLADESYTVELHTKQELDIIEEKWNRFLGRITGIIDKVTLPKNIPHFAEETTKSINNILDQHSETNIILYALFRELFYVKKEERLVVNTTQPAANTSSDKSAENLVVLAKKIAQTVSAVSEILPHGAEIKTLAANLIAFCEQASQKTAHKQCGKKAIEIKKKYIQFNQYLQKCTEAYVKTNPAIKNLIQDFKTWWLDNISESKNMADLLDDDSNGDEEKPKEKNQGASSAGASTSAILGTQTLKKSHKKSKKKNQGASNAESSTPAILDTQTLSAQSVAVLETEAEISQISSSVAISTSAAPIITSTIMPTIPPATEIPVVRLAAQVAATKQPEIKKAEEKADDDQNEEWQVIGVKHEKKGNSNTSDRVQRAMPQALSSHPSCSRYNPQRQFKEQRSTAVAAKTTATKPKGSSLAITTIPKADTIKPVGKTTWATVVTGIAVSPTIASVPPVSPEPLSKVPVAMKVSEVSSVALLTTASIPSFSTLGTSFLSDTSLTVLNHSRVSIPASPPLSPLTPLSLSPILGADHENSWESILDISNDTVAIDSSLVVTPYKSSIGSQGESLPILKTPTASPDLDTKRVSSPVLSNLSTSVVGSPISPASATLSIQSFDAGADEYPKYLQNAAEIIREIESHGYQAIAVGGVVINYLQGSKRRPSDIDLRTNMPRAEFVKLYKVFTPRECPYDPQLLTLAKYEWLVDIYCLGNDEYEERLTKLQSDSLIGEQVYWHPHPDTKKYPLLVQDEVKGVFSPPGDAIKRVKECNFMQDLDLDAVRKNPLLILRLLYRVVESGIRLSRKNINSFASYKYLLSQAILGTSNLVKPIARGQLLVYLKKFLTKDKFFNYVTTFEQVSFMRYFLPDLYVNKWHTQANRSEILNYAHSWFYEKLREIQIIFREQKVNTYDLILGNYFVVSFIKKKLNVNYNDKGVFLNDMEKMANIIFDFLYSGDAAKVVRSASNILKVSMIALNQLYICTQHQQPNKLPTEKQYWEACIAKVLEERQQVKSGCKDITPRRYSSSHFFTNSMVVQSMPSEPILSMPISCPPPCQPDTMPDPMFGFASQEYYPGYQEAGSGYWNGAGFFPPPYCRQDDPLGQYYNQEDPSVQCYNFSGTPPTYT